MSHLNIALTSNQSLFEAPKELYISAKSLALLNSDIIRFNDTLKEMGSLSERLVSFQLNKAHYPDLLTEGSDLNSFDFEFIECSEDCVSFVLCDIDGKRALYTISG